MAEGDVYKVIDKQTYLGDELENVYWYGSIDSIGSAEGVCTAFRDDMVSVVRTIQHANLVHHHITAVNMNEDADFHELALTTDNTGTQTGETLPRYNAYGFKLHRPTRAVRSGAKRIAGVPEGWQDGGVLDSTFDDEVDAVAVAMGGTIKGEDDSEYQPKIVTLNRLTGAIVNSYGINTASFVRLTTQNTRK